MPVTDLDARRNRPKHYRIPADTVHGELEAKRSVFISTVGHAVDVAAAQAFVERVRETYADADHNAWAYYIDGGPQGLLGFSDDGEPGGTAGRPMVSIIEGSGILEIVAVVTRYFGGTKLGTGGLVRAYGGALRDALARLPTDTMTLHHRARFTIDYALYGTLQYLLPRQGVVIEDTSFADRATIEVAIPYRDLDSVAEEMRELTNGRVELQSCIMGQRYVRATT